MLKVFWVLIVAENVIGRVERPFFMPEFDISVPEVAGGACRTDGDILAEATRNHSLWAMQMWDATAQGLVGALYGNTWQLGHFDECLKQVTGPIKAQYCLLTVQYNMSYTGSQDDVAHVIKESREDRRFARRDILHAGVCVPASCSARELQIGLQRQMDKFYHGDLSYTVTVTPNKCTSSLIDPPWSTNEICFGLVLLTLIILAIFGSYCGSGQTRTGRILECFSVPKNLDRIFQRNESTTQNYFSVFDVFRVISMLVTIAGHRLLISSQGNVFNLREEGFHAMSSAHLDLLVDIFFFMSALLATNLNAPSWTQNRLKCFQELLRRLFRLAPAYYLLVWFQASVAHRLGSGPVWNSVARKDTENCQNYWWANILFVNNYLPTGNDCMIHFWYMACEMQFAVMLMAVVYLLINKPLLGKTFLALLMVVTTILQPLSVYLHNADPMMIVYDLLQKDIRESYYFSYVYRPGHMRAFPYLLGISVGYFLHLKRNSKIILSPRQVLWCFIGSVVIMCTPMVLGGSFHSSPSNVPGLAFTMFYSFIRRPTFAIGFACLFLTHRYSAKDYTAWICRSRIVQVLSKLSYMMYLIHYPYIYYGWPQNQSPIRLTRSGLVRDWISDIVILSFPAAIFLVLIEQPINNLYREVLVGEKEPKKSTPFSIVENKKCE